VAYKQAETAAFVPDPDGGPLGETYYALAFPARWQEPIRRLLYGEKPGHEDRRGIPITGINSVIRAMAPDLVSVTKRATRDDRRPWLYTGKPYPEAILKQLIVTWLHTRKSSPKDYDQLSRTIEELDIGALHWDLMAVSLTQQTLSPGGTAVPEDYLYHVLPDILAARIREKIGPYEYCGKEVEFYQVATSEGAELMSWPPCEYIPEYKGTALQPWHFSGTIKIRLRTVPLDPVPRIHLSVGIRRWERGDKKGRVRWSGGDLPTVYLRADGPWLHGAGQPARFASAPLKVWYDNDEVMARWTHGSPAAMMERLDISRDFPDATKLAQDAEGWLDHVDGVTAAVTYHTVMGYHGVGAGIMPVERQRLIHWAGRALAPYFKPAPSLVKEGKLPSKPVPVIEQPPRSRKPRRGETEEQAKERFARQAAEMGIANAVRRRQRLAAAAGESGVFSCHLLYQTEQVRKALIAAAAASLGLEGHLILSPADEELDGTWAWRTPELEVRIHMRELGALGGPLVRGAPPKRGKETQQAIEVRRREVRDFLRGLPESGQVQGVLVELNGKEAYPNRLRTTDPKFAIRLGCADTGLVSQFIAMEEKKQKRGKADSGKPAEAPADAEQEAAQQDTPADPDPEATEKKPSLGHRAKAAWADLLRQAGMNFIPQHSLGDEAIPEGTSQVAFWIIRRNSDGLLSKPQFTPIAILSRPGQPTVMGRMPGEDWMPYPKLLTILTGKVRGDQEKYEEDQKRAAAIFIRDTLGKLAGTQVVVMAYAQNARSRWEFLGDGRIILDKIQFGDGPVQRIALHRGLRLIRVRDGLREETPQWWASDDNGQAGLSLGFWAQASDGDPAADDRRVFYGTAEKGVTHKDAGRTDSKLTPHVATWTVKKDDGTEEEKTGVFINADKPAWNPTLLEITAAALQPADDPRLWAMYTHQQRFPDDYPDGLKLPHVLHLAELATEYALPHEYKILDEDSDESEDKVDGGENGEGDADDAE
jgi:hypothetical protein